ncbi:hypothetical protein OAS73_03775 [Luminiphilus sp.]|nr:hypothetical protein [Luminiphilus sp.]
MSKSNLLPIILALSFFTPLGFADSGRLENPSEGGDYAGIQLFSGWVCDAEILEVLVDGAQYLTVPYGSDRLDTLSVCGDRNNGFGLLFNVANLGSGEHTATLFADGQEIDKATFNVTRLSTGEFAEDLAKCAVVDGFPTSDKEIVLAWSEASQNFQIKSERLPPLPQRIDGLWSNELNEIYLWAERNIDASNCAAGLRLYANGLMAAKSEYPEIIDLFGSGSENNIDMFSTGRDATKREMRFEFQADGSLIMRVISCPATPFCDKTPQGSIIVFQKVLDPFDQNYLPPLKNLQ